MTRKQKYQAYLRSPDWAARRRDYYATHPKICSACGTDRNIHLHHKTYVRLGAELDRDLVPLCAPCHHDEHRRKREKRLRDGPRARGTNPRAKGTNPRAHAVNPRAKGTNLRAARKAVAASADPR